MLMIGIPTVLLLWFFASLDFSTQSPAKKPQFMPFLEWKMNYKLSHAIFPPKNCTKHLDRDNIGIPNFYTDDELAVHYKEARANWKRLHPAAD